MLKKRDGTTDWSANIQWIIIIGLILLGLYKVLTRPDRELTPLEQSGNVSICHQYYGNGQGYQDCVIGRYLSN